MSIKRIALISAVAVTAMALVGGGYAAAQNTGESTTLITTPGPETTSQAYRGATTSELSQPGVQALAGAYSAGCSATTSGTTIDVTVTGSPGTPQGTVTLTGYDGTKTKTLSGGQTSHTYPAGVAGQTITFTYGGGGGYPGCSGSIAFAKATPTCNLARTRARDADYDSRGGAGTPTGNVRFFDDCRRDRTYADVPVLNGSASRDYGITIPHQAPVKVTIPRSARSYHRTRAHRQSVNLNWPAVHTTATALG